MIRYNAIQEIMNHITNELIICNIGFPCKELYSIKDRKENFYIIQSQ